MQPVRPLIPENRHSENDLMKYAQINPSKPTGLEPPPKDPQFEVPMQPVRPLIPENRHSENDLMKYA